MAKQWYIVETYFGQEEKIKRNMEQRIQKAGLSSCMGRIVVPDKPLRVAIAPMVTRLTAIMWVERSRLKAEAKQNKIWWQFWI